jgi:hypothetical protein
MLRFRLVRFESKQKIPDRYPELKWARISVLDNYMNINVYEAGNHFQRHWKFSVKLSNRIAVNFS